MASGQNPQQTGQPSRPGYDQQPPPNRSDHQPSPSGSGYEQSPGRYRRNGGENIPMEQINPGFQEIDDEGPWDNNFDNNANTELRQRKPSLYRQSSASDANELLSMMPSRHFQRGKSRKLHAPSADDEVHRSASRKSLKRQNSMYQTLRGKPDEEVLDDIISDIGSDPKMAASDVRRDEHIRNIPTNLTNRRTIKRRVDNFERSAMDRAAKPGTLKRAKYQLQLGFRTVKLGVRDTLYRFDLWHSHLHLIEGHFGTGVVSYFLFLRTLLYLNIPVFLLSLSFIIIPQMLYRFFMQDPPGYVNNDNFTGRELLTGAGWFENTEMYYGTYFNGTISIFTSQGNKSSEGGSGASYDMAYAYLLTSGGFYLLCLVILARALARSYRKNFIEASGEVAFYYMGKVLCGWDFSISQPNTAKLRHKAIFNELTEYLSSSRQMKVKKTCKQICCLVFLRTVTNLFVLGLIGGSGYLIWYISITKSIQNNIDVLSEMAMPLCISGFNLILPIAFSIIGAVEQWERPKIELYLTMLRTISLKGVNLGVLIFFWYKNVSCETPEDRNEYQKSSRCIGCWETFMGVEVYKLVIVDFIVSLLVTFMAEFMRSVMAKRCCKLLGSPEFEIGRNTLNLIYSQALCWLGHFYCPVLSFIQIIKLIVIFYVKRLSVMMNCVPSQKPWRAARAHTIFLGYLFCAYFMMCSSLAVSIVLVQPSATCGPFRGLKRPYDVIINLLLEVKKNYNVIDGILMFISSHGFIAACLVALCIGVYYLSMLGKTRREMIALLKHQIQLEGKDKVFLLRMYQEISKDIGGGLPAHKPLMSTEVEADPSPNPRRRFVKALMEEAKEERSHASSLVDEFRKEAKQRHRAGSGGDLTSGRHSAPWLSPRKQIYEKKSSSSIDVSRTTSPVSVSRSFESILHNSNISKTGDYENMWELREKPKDSGAESEEPFDANMINVGKARLKNPLYEEEDVGPPPRAMSSSGHKISVEGLSLVSEEGRSSGIPSSPPGPAVCETQPTPREGHMTVTDVDPMPEHRISHGEKGTEPTADYEDNLSNDPCPDTDPVVDPLLPPASCEPPVNIASPMQQSPKKQGWHVDHEVPFEDPHHSELQSGSEGVPENQDAYFHSDELPPADYDDPHPQTPQYRQLEGDSSSSEYDQPPQ